MSELYVIPDNDPAWNEYDSAAEWCARRDIKGNEGDALPALLSGRCLQLINDDPSAFRRRICDSAYTLAMESHQ